MAIVNDTTVQTEIEIIIEQAEQGNKRALKVLYHHPCNDGFASAWAAYRFFKENPSKYYSRIDYLPVSYGVRAPELDSNDSVYIVDFSYPRAVLERMKAQVAYLQVIDHHKTAEEELKDLNYCLFDMKRSGAQMTWDYFHSDKPTPKLISYVQDNDLWRHKLPHSKQITRWISSFPMTFDAWDEMHMRLEVSPNSVFMEAVGIERAFQMQLNSILTNSIPIIFEDIDTRIVNCSKIFVSEVCHKLLNDWDLDMAMGWHMLKDGKIEISLRTDGIIDVSKIAKRYGGGGHSDAAGFKTSMSWLDDLISNHRTDRD